jgi:hypothetical protein
LYAGHMQEWYNIHTRDPGVGLGVSHRKSHAYAMYTTSI